MEVTQLICLSLALYDKGRSPSKVRLILLTSMLTHGFQDRLWNESRSRRRSYPVVSFWKETMNTESTELSKPSPSLRAIGISDLEISRWYDTFCTPPRRHSGVWKLMVLGFLSLCYGTMVVPLVVNVLHALIINNLLPARCFFQHTASYATTD